MIKINIHEPVRKNLQPWRRILRRYGFGVHSPFVYHLITKVITERCPFYCFHEIEAIRERMLNDTAHIHTSDRSQPVSRIVAREAISPKKGALLFRLANHLKPEYILQIGATTGLSTLYLSSYRQGLRCINIENDPSYVPLSAVVHRQAKADVEHYTGEYSALLPAILDTLPRLDFVYLNAWKEHSVQWILNTCLERSGGQTVIVVEGIWRNRRMRTLWRHVRTHPDVTVTFDLGATGIIFLNPKLHRKNYKLYF